MLLRVPIRSLAGLLVVSAVLTAIGCGGSGGGGASDGAPAPAPTPAAPELTSARVTVDTKTGEVVVNNQPPATGRAAFAPGAVTLWSNSLIDEVGSTGRKVLNLYVKNNQPVPIGVDGDIRVTLSGFSNLTSSTTDVSSSTTVQTVAGSDAGGTGDGAAIGNVLQDAGGIYVDGPTVYFTSRTDGKVKKLENGQVNTLCSGLINPQGITSIPLSTQWLFVAETGRNRIIKVPRQGGSPVQVAGGAGGVAGDVLGGPTDARFNAPTGVLLRAYRDGSLQGAYRLFVTDSNNNKVKVIEDPSGAANTTAFATTTGKPQHITGGFFTGVYGSQALLFITTKNHLVQSTIESSAPAAFTTIAGTGAPGMVDGDGSVAQLNDPQGIAFVNGALLVGDKGNFRVRQLTLNGTGSPGSASSWRTANFAGTVGGTAVDGPGAASVFAAPGAVGFGDQSGLFVGDLNRIRKITSEQIPVVVGTDGGSASTAKVSVTNPAGYSAPDRPYFFARGNLDPGSSQKIDQITFIVPENVRMFQFNVRVEGTLESPTVLDAQNGVGSKEVSAYRIAGVNGGGFQDGPGMAARFNGITGLWSLKNGVVYIADKGNHAVRRMDANGRVVTILGGPTKGSAFVAGTGAEAAIPQVYSVWMNEAETEGFITSLNTVCRLTRTGADPGLMSSWSVTVIAGSTSGLTDGKGDVAKFNAPKGILSTSETELLVCDQGNGKVRRMTQVGTNRAASSNWSVSSLNSMSNPVAIAPLPTGEYMVTGSYGVYLMSPTGSFVSYAGLIGTSGYIDGARNSARFGVLGSIAADLSGYAYVLETSLGRIRRVSRNSESVGTVLTGSNVGGAEGTGDVASLNTGSGALAMTRDGDLYAADLWAIWTVRRIVHQ